MKYLSVFVLGFIFAILLESNLPIGIKLNTCYNGNNHYGMLTYSVKFNKDDPFVPAGQDLIINSWSLFLDTSRFGGECNK